MPSGRGRAPRASRGAARYVVRCGPGLAAASLVAACSSEGRGPAVERLDSAGVELVVGSPEDAPRRVRFEPEFALGGRSAGPESFFRVAAGLVGVDALGRIHVLDPEKHRVVVFDGAGRHLWSAGREGEGPGELGRPAGLVVSPDGESLVLDFSKRALVGFRDGVATAGRTFPFPFFGGGMGFQGEDLLLLPAVGLTGVQALVRVTPAGDTSVVRSREGAALRPVHFASCNIGMNGMPPLFDPVIQWDARGALLAVAPGPAYRIELYRGADLVRIVTRDLDLRRADRSAALSEVGEGMRIGTPGGERICDPAEVVEQRGYVPEMPWIGRVRLGPSGGLWVERFAPGPDASGPVDLFDASGAYTGTLPAGTAFPLAFLPDGRVLTREVDETTGVERLVVGRVTIGGAEE